MDPLTHALASFALKRAFFPKAERPVLISMLFAGTLIDLDWLSSLLGPSAFLKWNGGPLHSIVGSLLLAFLISAAIRAYAKTRGVLLQGTLWWLAPICAALLHVGMDALTSSGIKLFWPITAARIALDWLPSFDLWILILIALGILLPELFRLVTDEIGAKSKKPRGQAGAIVAFTFLAVYVVGRGMLHGNAVLLILERSYAGESARRGAAFPDATSPFQWHAIVETASALHLVQVPTGPMANFDPESAARIHKPDPSPMLDSAQETQVAVEFMAVARFPKATVLKEPEGYSVSLHDFKYDALGQTSRVVDLDINLDNAGRVTFAHLDWRDQARLH